MFHSSIQTLSFNPEPFLTFRTRDIWKLVKVATKWLKVAKSGTSPLPMFWKNSEFFKDTLRTKITLRNLLKEIVCENQNFRSDLTVLTTENVDASSDKTRAMHFMNEQRLWRLPEHLCLFCQLCTCSYDNHDKCTCRVHYCLAVFQTLFFHSFMHYLPKTWSPNQNFKHVTDQVKPFSFTMPKIATFRDRL